MLSHLRDTLYRAITTSRGDALAPVRVPKDLARRLNATLGRPLAPREELEKRAEARARLEVLRAGGGQRVRVAAEAAPILLYFEKDRNVRELTRIEELLGAKGLQWKRLDVTADQATIDFVTRKAGCERDDLPVVFVADRAVGGYDALVKADVSGELAQLTS
jgi:hypothetical protein